MIQTDPKEDMLKQQLSKELKFPKKQVESVIALLDEGNTVPFIARYRKEITGALDEVQIRDIMEGWQYIKSVEQRKEDVIRLIDEQGKLTDELRTEITNANKLQIIEDLYRPYKQKRRTRATVAKEKGLEPLAEWMMSFPTTGSLEEYAAQFVSEEKEVVDFTEAINGAKDIIAEQISDDASIRQWVRKETFQSGNMTTSVKNEEKDEKKVFEMYYEYEEPVKRIVPHRTLALNRGEKEDILRVSVKPDTERIVQYLNNRFIKNSQSIVAAEVMEAVEDGYKD